MAGSSRPAVHAPPGRHQGDRRAPPGRSPSATDHGPAGSIQRATLQGSRPARRGPALRPAGNGRRKAEDADGGRWIGGRASRPALDTAAPARRSESAAGGHKKGPREGPSRVRARRSRIMRPSRGYRPLRPRIPRGRPSTGSSARTRSRRSPRPMRSRSAGPLPARVPL